MNLILSATTIIGKIIEKDIPLAKAAKEHFALHYYTREDRKIIKALVVSTLKHRYVLGRIVLDNFPSIKMSDKRIIIVGLANTIFVKGISDDETMEQITSLISNDNISYHLLERILHQHFDVNNLVPSYVIPNSIEYFHLRYNIPVWLIEMWGKHYGKVLLPRLVGAISKKYVPTLRVNKAKISRKELLSKYPATYENGFSETTVRYLGTRAVSKVDAVKKGELIPISESLNHVANKLSLKGRDEILVMADAHSPFVLALDEKMSSKNRVLYALSTYDEVVEARKAIEACGFGRFEIVESPLSLLVTHVSHPHDLVVVLPPSSNFQSIAYTPDFFTHFTADKLDKILKTQQDYLEECSSYVEEGGQLLYLVETGNNKEGTLQIKYFLESHKEFSLVEERQMLPIDKRGGFCYFALLKKGGRK